MGHARRPAVTDTEQTRKGEMRRREEGNATEITAVPRRTGLAGLRGAWRAGFGGVGAGIQGARRTSGRHAPRPGGPRAAHVSGPEPSAFRGRPHAGPPADYGSVPEWLSACGWKSSLGLERGGPGGRGAAVGKGPVALEAWRYSKCLFALYKFMEKRP